MGAHPVDNVLDILLDCTKPLWGRNEPGSDSFDDILLFVWPHRLWQIANSVIDCLENGLVARINDRPKPPVNKVPDVFSKEMGAKLENANFRLIMALYPHCHTPKALQSHTCQEGVDANYNNLLAIWILNYGLRLNSIDVTALQACDERTGYDRKLREDLDVAIRCNLINGPDFKQWFKLNIINEYRIRIMEQLRWNVGEGSPQQLITIIQENRILKDSIHEINRSMQRQKASLEKEHIAIQNRANELSRHSDELRKDAARIQAERNACQSFRDCLLKMEEEEKQIRQSRTILIQSISNLRKQQHELQRDVGQQRHKLKRLQVEVSRKENELYLLTLEKTNPEENGKEFEKTVAHHQGFHFDCSTEKGDDELVNKLQCDPLNTLTETQDMENWQFIEPSELCE